jgi:hypothetical protein
MVTIARNRLLGKPDESVFFVLVTPWYDILGFLEHLSALNKPHSSIYHQGHLLSKLLVFQPLYLDLELLLYSYCRLHCSSLCYNLNSFL